MSSGGTSKPSSIFIRALYLLTNIRASRQFGRFFEYLVARPLPIRYTARSKSAGDSADFLAAIRCEAAKPPAPSLFSATSLARRIDAM